MSARDRDPGNRITRNPFYVLRLDPDCSRAEVEREGHKLLAMLQVGLSGAKTYHTPLGRLPRTPEIVREAMAELRDPDRRLSHELWARTRTDAQPADASAPAVAKSPPDAAQDVSDSGEQAAPDPIDDPIDDPVDAPVDEQAPWPGATALLGWRRR